MQIFPKFRFAKTFVIAKVSHNISPNNLTEVLSKVVLPEFFVFAKMFVFTEDFAKFSFLHKVFVSILVPAYQ
jgi:hypothetical protein